MLEPGALNKLNTWEANAALAAELAELATKLGYAVRHNQTNYGKFAGKHRYVILRTTEETTDISIRSRAFVAFMECNNSKYFRPAKKRAVVYAAGFCL